MWHLKFHTEYFRKPGATCPTKCYERSVSLGVSDHEAREAALRAAFLQWDKEVRNDPTVHLPRLIWEEDLLSAKLF